MLSLYCCLFTILGQSLASPSSNQYVDNVIYSTLQTVIRNEKLDPAPLPNFEFEYKDKTFFGNVKGRAEYTDGYVNGLSQVRRYSECDGPRNVSQSTVINCTLTFNNLDTGYEGKVKYGVVPKVSIHGKGDIQRTIVRVGIAKSLYDRSARVESFDFLSVGSMSSATFTGLGPLNKQTKVLEENYKGRVSAEVSNVIINRFRYALNLAVSQVPMPVR